MPFIKKNDAQGSQPSTDARNIFIGRASELLFFVQNILEPESPTHNILSISGPGGVGKSTLLTRFDGEAHSANFKDYCLTAIVDERQTTPAGMMEKLAQQLHLAGEFEKVLKQYKEALRRQQVEQEMLRGTLRESVPDLAGAVFDGIPVAGPLLREGTKVAARHILKKDQAFQVQQDAKLLETPLEDLTRAFVTELNRLADAKVTLGSPRKKRRRRIALFFDTFEQLAADITPWLLDHFLAAEVSGNVVLVIAGRDPIERTSPDNPKRWLEYCNDGTIFWIVLNCFTEEETHGYLVKRGITDGDRIATLWQKSQGLPLYLGLLTSNPQAEIDPTKDVVVNFLRWIPGKEHIKQRLALDAALLSRPFNQDDLEVFFYVSEADRVPLYRWLTGQSFVQSRTRDGRYLYHDVARDMFSRHLYQRSQKDYYEIRRRLVTYYRELLEKVQAEKGQEVYRSEEWLELLLAVVSQLLLLPDSASHIQAIEYVLRAYHKHANTEQDAAIARVLRDLSQELSPQPISPTAREVARQLHDYVEADYRNQAGLSAASALIEKAAQVPSFPSSVLALIYYRRGNAYDSFTSEFSNRELANEDYQRALKLFEATDYNERGWAYFYSGDFREAFAIHNHVLEQNPKDVDACFGRGWASLRLEEYQQAIADFERVLELSPNFDNPGGLYNGFWQAYYGAGKYQQALSMTDRLIEVDPRYAWAYTGQSNCFIALKEYQRAIEVCNHALELAKEEAIPYSLGQVYFQRGLAYLWMRDPQQAQADFARSYELHSKWIRSALLTEWTGLCKETADTPTSERLEAIAAIDPQGYVAHTCQGIALLLRRDFGKALAQLEQALVRKQNNWEAHFWKGVAHAFLEQDEEAITAIEKALDLKLPPILLTPLRWFEEGRPDFYGTYVMPLLAKHA